MTNQHPITLPPDELVQQWRDLWAHEKICCEMDDFIAVMAARWGADQELDACCEWVAHVLELPGSAKCLREDRRPKAPTLKEQALDELDLIPIYDNEGRTVGVDVSIIRRALKALPE